MHLILETSRYLHKNREVSLTIFAFFGCWTKSIPRMAVVNTIHSDYFNSLAPGKFEWNFRHVIFKQILVIDGWGISCEIALIWMSQDFTNDQSTLVQVMAWCRQAHMYLLQWCHNGVMVSQITSVSIIYWTVWSGTDQRKHQIKALRHWPLWGEFTGDWWIDVSVMG